MRQGGNQMFASPMEALAHISEKSWSDYTKADYSIEQWHAACLIHIHDGAPTSKSQCKLPVKTPNGAVNRNGVHSAAAALAGARGGLKGVSADQKSAASNALRRYYAQLDEDPPESLAVHGVAFVSDILSHHGVKGMKWGQRKEEEPVGRIAGAKEASSPTSAAKSTSTPAVKPASVPAAKLISTPAVKPVTDSIPVLSEKKQRKVDKFVKRAEIMDTHISELKLRNEELAGAKAFAKKYELHNNKQTLQLLEQNRTQATKDAEAVRKGKLTSGQKKALIGAAAVTAIIGGIAISGAVAKGQQSGALNSYKLIGQARLRGQASPFRVNKELSGKMSASELLKNVVKPVNPGYSTAGGHMNCRRSTFAYELRRRGFDVHATTSAVGWGQSESGVINALTPGSRNFYNQMSLSGQVARTGADRVASGDKRLNPVKKLILDNLDIHAGVPSRQGYGSQKVFETLAKQPERSRGEVLFKFPGFGHSMQYEIINGKPHVFDSQKGTFHDLTQTVESKWGDFHGVEITRLDNVDLDLNFLTRWATNY